ncbi:MAG: hypothetical protein JW925_12800 [Syntrophaceae bacterium]|nr:hypothetical protein [Syntrophaceae bacterium]
MVLFVPLYLGLRAALRRCAGPLAAIAGCLIQGGAVVLSVLMWKSRLFGKPTAIIRIVGNGLDIIRLVPGLFVPFLNIALMGVAGPLMFVWMLLSEIRMLLLAGIKTADENNK